MHRVFENVMQKSRSVSLHNVKNRGTARKSVFASWHVWYAFTSVYLLGLK